jgi:K+-sensing histidine kinase KdpD
VGWSRLYRAGRDPNDWVDSSSALRYIPFFLKPETLPILVTGLLSQIQESITDGLDFLNINLQDTQKPLAQVLQFALSRQMIQDLEKQYRMPIIVSKLEDAKLEQACTKLPFYALSPAIKNTVHNALKYGTPGSSIEVKLSTEPNPQGGEWLVYTIENAGATDRDSVYNLFTLGHKKQKLTDSPTHYSSGNGIALLRRVTRQYGCELEYLSTTLEGTFKVVQKGTNRIETFIDRKRKSKAGKTKITLWFPISSIER